MNHTYTHLLVSTVLLAISACQSPAEESGACFTPYDSHGNDSSCQVRSTAADNILHCEETSLQENYGCRSDNDCILAQRATDCAGRCPIALSADAIFDWQNAIDKIDADYCDGYSDDGCTVTAVRCAQKVAVCENNTCTLADPRNEPTLEEREAQCRADRREAINRFTALNQTVENTCQDNSDCTVITSTSECWDSCPWVGSVEQAQASSNTSVQLDNGICNGFSERGCEKSSSQNCLSPVAVCRNSICVAEF